MAYETFSPEEVDGIVYRSMPKSTPATQPAPMQSSALPPVTSPIKPSKPKAAEPNVSQLVQNVSEANRSIQESTPAPQAPSAIDALVSDITSNWKTVLGAAAVPAIGWMASKMMGGKSTEESKPKAIKDRLLVPSERVEPTFSPPSKVGPITNMPGTPEELQKALGPNWEATLAKSEAARKEKQMLAQERARTSMGEIPAPVAQPPVPAPQPAAPSSVAQAAAQTAPVAPPTVAQIAQQAAPAITEAAQAPAESIPPAEKNKGGRPKGVQGKKWTYEAGAQLPEGTVFKEGWGGADNWLNNEVGKEKAKLIRETFNQGKPFGEGSKENMARAANAMNEFGLVQYMSGDQPKILSKENRERFGIAPPEQHGRLNKTFDKAVKVGGVAGLLLTAAEAANAKQAAQNIGEALLPIGMTPSDLASGTLTEKQLRAYQEAQKLGSPYRSVPPPR
jgi:hypothetical protein